MHKVKTMLQFTVVTIITGVLVYLSVRYYDYTLYRQEQEAYRQAQEKQVEQLQKALGECQRETVLYRSADIPLPSLEETETETEKGE